MTQRVNILWDHHFVVIPPGDSVLQTPGKILLCEAGDLCLWDSRTVHCNSPGRRLPEAQCTEGEGKPGEVGEGKGEAAPAISQPTDVEAASNAMKAALEGAPKPPSGLTWQEKQKFKREAEMNAKRPMYLAKKAQKKWELLRLIGYVCMTPTSFATRDVVKQRQEAVANQQGTSHWPQFFLPSGREQPPFESNPYITKELIVGNSGTCALM